jgi:hypothetical protein
LFQNLNPRARTPLERDPVSPSTTKPKHRDIGQLAAPDEGNMTDACYLTLPRYPNNLPAPDKMRIAFLLLRVLAPG